MAKEKDREQRIRERAYQMWLNEGRPEGRDKEHWQEAEKQMAEEEQQGLFGAPPLAGPYDNMSYLMHFYVDITRPSNDSENGCFH